MSDPGPHVRDIEGVLAELSALARRRGGAPDRHHARGALLALGRLALAEGEEAAAPWVERLAGALAPFAEAFERAVHEELALAADEHVRGVDPRYLDHPRYDLGYAVLARERLEERLVAADLLGVEPDEALLERVAGADRLLEPYLKGPGEGDPGEGTTERTRRDHPEPG